MLIEKAGVLFEDFKENWRSEAVELCVQRVLKASPATEWKHTGIPLYASGFVMDSRLQDS